MVFTLFDLKLLSDFRLCGVERVINVSLATYDATTEDFFLNGSFAESKDFSNVLRPNYFCLSVIVIMNNFYDPIVTLYRYIIATSIVTGSYIQTVTKWRPM